MNEKKFIFILVGLAALVVVLVIGSAVLLRRFGVPETKTENGSTVDPNQTTSLPEHDQGVVYSDTGFSPKSLTIKISSGIGCLITVTNTTERPIRVGVGPHSDSGDPGADYGEIEPGGMAILDVRYPGLEKISLHDHVRSEHSFDVSYGDGCR